jgi:hypothetical protein
MKVEGIMHHVHTLFRAGSSQANMFCHFREMLEMEGGDTECP